MNFTYSESAVSISELNKLVADTDDCETQVSGSGEDNFLYLVDQSLAIISKLIEDLARGLGARTFSNHDIQKLRNMILEQYQNELSLNGLAHCFYLIQCGESPCNKEVMGFNIQSILINVGNYVKKIKEIRSDLDAQHERDIMRQQQFGKPQNAAFEQPEVLDKMKELRLNLERKHPVVDIEKVLKKIIYNSVEEYCEINLVSYDDWVNNCKAEYEAYKNNIEMNLEQYIDHCKKSFLKNINGL